VQRDVVSRNDAEVNKKYQVNISKDLQHWKGYMILWIYAGLVEVVLEEVSKLAKGGLGCY
jgi:hypothetical protein